MAKKIKIKKDKLIEDIQEFFISSLILLFLIICLTISALIILFALKHIMISTIIIIVIIFLLKYVEWGEDNE